MQKINRQMIRASTGNAIWDLSNQILYEMCQKYPHHKNDEEIVAKLLIIGRVYSAALERRKLVNNSSGMFYLREVAPAIRESDIDVWLKSLKHLECPTYENCSQMIAVHKKVTDLFREISGLEKRSLASKYLHFHFPNLFYICDSRSLKSIKQIEKNPNWELDLLEYDHIYAKFFLQCVAFVEKVNNECKIYLTPRQLDKYLLS